MDQEEIRQLWADGEDWIIKRCNNEYFYRPDGKCGEWLKGLPPGTFPPDIETLFED